MDSAFLESMRARLLLLVAASLLGACGGGGSDSASPPPPLSPDPWQSVTAALNSSDIDDLALIVGDANGELYRFEKGGFAVSDIHSIASASKWITSSTIVSLVDQGVMDLSDRPQDYLAYWTNDPSDPRSRITLEQLLSFTAGFHRSPIQAGCIGNETYTVQTCVAELYAQGVDAEPGTTYFYGPVHMQVAAAMAEVATGQVWNEIVFLNVTTPLGLSATGFTGDNPRASGSAFSTALDYSEFLRAQLAGDFLSASFDTLAAERLSGVQIVSRPGAIDDNNIDWYYGLGVWRECDDAVWNATCDANVRVSSPGAFGWYPWIDVQNGYYAVLAMEEPITLFNDPSSDSVLLGSSLRPLIEDVLSE